ncbi:dihydrolipoyl dehydrogenase family protein [Terriglobus albidus]|uniref:dihydrolipoyl dehydrogenase family protein n=1 Tax=Terriglobus albidus TaxID=1592106 RepID=UPI0021E0BB98|nr:FAD-dependent oxidoreductase [Terriglobus albidus]
MSSPSSQQPEAYDLVIIGSGAGTKLSAWTFAGRGQRVAVIERKYVGGACPNIACLPSKNIIHTAQVVAYARRGEEFGIRMRGMEVDMPAVRERKRSMVAGLVETHLDLYRQSGAELIMGNASFIGPKTVEVTLQDGRKRVLVGKNVIIGTGTHAAVDRTPGLAEAQPLTHVEALELDYVPERLIILGGGYVGLEFAQAMRRFGSKVTVIDRNSRVLHREDEDVTEAIHGILRDEGIEFALGTPIQKVTGVSGQTVKVFLHRPDGEAVVEGTHLLVATGRVPNTQGLGLEATGVQLTKSGYIQVNERLETTAPGVWAVGEIAGSPQFTHVSEDDFRVVKDNLDGRNRVTTGRLVPFCLFTDPEFARVGLSETQAKASGIRYRLFRAPMAAVLRARALMETQGFMKALVGDDDRILGFSGLGTGAGEVMSAVQIAMLAGLPYTALRDAMLAHPTLVEGVHMLFESEPTTQTR